MSLEPPVDPHSTIRLEACRIVSCIDSTDDEDELKILRAQYNAVIDELQQLRGVDLFSTIPTELILTIFKEHCADDPYGPFILSLVCKRWLEILSESPELWTNIIIGTNEPEWQRRLEAFYRHSKERTLDVTLFSPLSAEELQQICDFGNLERWKSLTIIDNSSVAERDPWRFPLRLSQSSIILKLFQNKSFPKLCSIDVQSKTIDTRAPLIWSRLFTEKNAISHLSTQSILLSHLTVNLFFIGITSLLDALKEVPNLLYLKLAAQRRVPVEDMSIPSSEPILLYHLKDLIMEDGSPTQILIDRLDFPRVQYLKLSVAMGSLAEIYNRIRNLGDLKHLYLALRGNRASLPQNSVNTIQLERLQIEHYFSEDGPQVTGAGLFYHDYLLPLLRLFPSVKRMSLLMDNFQHGECLSPAMWNEVGKLLPLVEDLSIQETRNRLSSRPDHSQDLPLVLLPLLLLRSLRLKGQICEILCNTIEAPLLQNLHLSDAKEFDSEILMKFLLRSPHIRSLKLDSMQKPSWESASKTTKPILYSFEEVTMSHDVYDIFQGVEPTIQTLRLTGVLQGVAMKREMYHFDKREIHLRVFQERSSILHTVTHLDLCIANILFPVVSDLTDVLPYLSSLEKISLPRALLGADVLVDKLVQGLLLNSWCPKLKEIHTEDYPAEWDGLMELIMKRSRLWIMADMQDHRAKTVANRIECIRLPALPHISVLLPLQMVLAGKFLLSSQQSFTPGNVQQGGCDDCSLSGWNCLEQNIEQHTRVRSQCSRHKLGMVRITAYS